MAEMKPLIVVWFSCGAASAVAAKLTLEQYRSTHQVILANTELIEEGSDNRRFLRDVENWLGVDIVDVFNPKYPNKSVRELWEARKYMSGRKGAVCTTELKKEARYIFERKYDIAWHVMGYVLEEETRHDRFVRYERSNLLPVLIDAGLSKDDCFKIVQSAGIELPEAYRLGYPNANCIGCVKVTSVTYWNHVRRVHPEVFVDRAEQSRRLGVRLTRYKGQRIFLDELPADAVGHKMKSPECSIFCDLPK